MNIFKHIRYRLLRTQVRIARVYDYCVYGVWTDMRNLFLVKLVKTLNLSVRAFFNGDIQSKACAMTYRTMLALVPAIALIYAIGRGFGLQEVLENEIAMTFPAQKEVVNQAFVYVESYLEQSSSGSVFVGLGILLLLWTLVSILSSVEKAFNDIWGIQSGRSYWRKITDYLAIFFILPILMIAASGIMVYVTTALDKVFPSSFVTPFVTVMLDLASLVLIWFFFTGVYKLMPNTKVKFSNAFMAGVFAGTAFIILQWLFITGQIYVSKYNAIYGSVAFIPLFLIWLQFTWMITLTGGVVCYASQNIYNFSYNRQIEHISHSYRLKIVVSVATIVVRNFLRDNRPTTADDIRDDYGFPSGLTTQCIDRLVSAGLLLRVIDDPKVEQYAYAPAVDPDTLTVGAVIDKVRATGAGDFLPDYDKRFASVLDAVDRGEAAMLKACSEDYLKDLSIEKVKSAKARLRRKRRLWARKD